MTIFKRVGYFIFNPNYRRVLMSALLQDTHQLPSTNLLNVLVQIIVTWSHSAYEYFHLWGGLAWKHAECDHVKKQAKKDIEAESFKHMKIKYPTIEEGHVGGNM
jgi:hypothetical protein